MVNIQDPSLPAWKGLFEWSIQNSDGTRPAQAPSPEELAWLQEAMAANLQDVAQRMRDIKSQLDKAPDTEAAPTLQQREALLDELLEIVEDINFARDLRGVGGLPTLLGLLADPAPGLRSRAAAVLAACAQNNAPVQQWLLEGGALPPLLDQLRDNDGNARASAHTAVSCLVRRHASALDALLQADGLDRISAGLADPSARVKRKAAQLLAYILGERPQLRGEAAAGSGGGVASALPPLMGSGDRDVREAALRLALLLAEDPASAPVLFQAPDFEAALKRLQIALDDAPAADADAAADESQLAARLAAAPRSPSGASAPRLSERQPGSCGSGGSSENASAAVGETESDADTPAAPLLMLGPPPR